MPMNITIKEIIENIPGVVLARGSRTYSIKGISIDSRKMNAKNMYICIKGKKYDGHDFSENALNNGATAIVVDNEDKFVPPGFFTVLKTKNNRVFMLKLANYILDKQNIKTIMITGSYGKTTTKELLYEMLSEKYNVLKTIENYNNDIGIPLSIFEYNEKDDIAVLEVGMNHAGEIKNIVDYIRPDIAAIINVSKVHIEFFESLSDIAKAKLEIISNPTLDTIAVINSKYKELGENFPNQFPGSAIFYKYYLSENTLNIIELEEKYKIPETSIGILDNITAAVIIARKLYISKDHCQNIICSPPKIKGRFNILRRNDYLIVDDSYNSSPETLKAAIKRFSNMDGKKVLIIGDMLELGKYSADSHKEIGTFIKENIDFEMIFTLGKFSKNIHTELLPSFKEKCFYSEDLEDLFKKINNNIPDECSVLIKGSRGMRLERILEKCFIT